MFFVIIFFLYNVSCYYQMKQNDETQTVFIFLFYSFCLLSPKLVSLFGCSCPHVGCGGGRRGKLHHAVLHPNGWWVLPHPDGDSGNLLPRGPISQRCNHQAPQTSHLRPCHLPSHGIPHPSLLPGRHTGRVQGAWGRSYVSLSAKMLSSPHCMCLWALLMFVSPLTC